ncbi:hypothetical protein [Vibrio sp. 10N.261.51.F12]|uniref:hypothetical protein n=1 Tax=Vibrio sp. 10N.261.51.F12 TaxID=3229679 RepID=UPI003552D2C9
MRTLPLAILISTITLAGCNNISGLASAPSVPSPITPSVVHGVKIEAVPAQFSAYSKAGYNRYVAVKAPNGKAIHILIMDRLTDFQIVKAVNVLNHYLTPVIGTQFGNAEQKQRIANAMANNGAILKLMNYHDEPKYNDDLDGQPLFEEEIQVEGGPWYVNQDYDHHRDASFEEILHLVHDYGIGILNAPSAGLTALPKFQKELNILQKQALNNSYHPPTDILKEWQQEISVDQEYFAAVIDSYYGLWGAFDGRGMGGLYDVKNRQDFARYGPAAQHLTEQIFSPTLTYDAYIADSFKGTFKLALDPKTPYTYQAQYLTKVTLTGTNNSNVELNEYDNTVTGNKGINTVVVHGDKGQYQIERLDDSTIQLIDLIHNRDGNNTLSNIENIQFADQTLTL